MALARCIEVGGIVPASDTIVTAATTIIAYDMATAAAPSSSAPAGGPLVCAPLHWQCARRRGCHTRCCCLTPTCARRRCLRARGPHTQHQHTFALQARHIPCPWLAAGAALAANAAREAEGDPRRDGAARGRNSGTCGCIGVKPPQRGKRLHTRRGDGVCESQKRAVGGTWRIRSRPPDSPPVCACEYIFFWV